jgi:magnesium transporter
LPKSADSAASGRDRPSEPHPGVVAMRAFFVGADGTVGETKSFDEIKEQYAAGAHIWVDLGAKSAVADEFLTETLKLHALTIHDIWEDRTLPKIEDFEEYLFILVHGVRAGATTAKFDLVEIDLVVGARFLLSHHKDACAITAVHEELLRSSKMLKRGPAWVLHAILDHLVDHYLPILDKYDEDIAKLEDDVMAHAGRPRGERVMSRMLSFKRTLQRLRRVSIYQREVLLRLSRGEFDEIPREASPFFRDVFDHFARVTDLTDSYRELVGGAVEAYLSVQSNRMNEVMKTLTLISTIMLPITFIAGVYGMNFEPAVSPYNMPELRWFYGYPFALCLMAVTATGIVIGFRKKRWL